MMILIYCFKINDGVDLGSWQMFFKEVENLSSGEGNFRQRFTLGNSMEVSKGATSFGEERKE